jgi:hypothetical protein
MNVRFSININTELNIRENFDFIRYDNKESLIDGDDGDIIDCDHKITFDSYALIIEVFKKDEGLFSIWLPFSKRFVESLKAMIIMIEAEGDECWEDYEN